MAMFTWLATGLLSVKQGDSFSYNCTYANTGSSVVSVGETAAFNEMCMAIVYCFPAAVAACN